MTRDEILERLRREAPALRARGVARLALFGSVARGEADAASDIDVFVELDPGRVVDLFGYAGIVADITDLLPGPVDVMNLGSARPPVRERALVDAVYAF